MTKKWQQMSDKELTQKELEKLGDEWQHRLGLCDIDIRFVKGKEGSLMGHDTYVNIRAINEEVLIHELLHALLLKHYIGSMKKCKKEGTQDEELAILSLTYGYLRAKYGD